MSKTKHKKESELTLSTTDRRVTGVAGGIAEYYQASPVWVRIVGVIVIVLSGILPGIIIYLILAAALRKGQPSKT